MNGIILVATVKLKGKKCPFLDVHRVEVLRLGVGLDEKVGGDLLWEDGAQLGLDDGIGDGGVGLLLGGRPQVTRVMSLEAWVNILPKNPYLPRRKMPNFRLILSKKYGKKAWKAIKCLFC